MALEIIRRKTDYGLRALVHLACSADGPVMVRNIAEAEGIPQPFLHKILEELADHGIVNVRRGRAGGFTLAADPERVSVRQVADILQGALAVNRCVLGNGACGREEECALHEAWVGVQAQIMDLLDRLSLADLVSHLPPAEAPGDGEED
jgi:Rrf2 family protein